MNTITHYPATGKLCTPTGLKLLAVPNFCDERLLYPYEQHYRDAKGKLSELRAQGIQCHLHRMPKNYLGVLYRIVID